MGRFSPTVANDRRDTAHVAKDTEPLPIALDGEPRVRSAPSWRAGRTATNQGRHAAIDPIGRRMVRRRTNH
jgi:hypothetical protein